MCAASPHKSTSGARLPARPQNIALRAPAPGHDLCPAGERREVAVAVVRAARVVEGPLYVSLVARGQSSGASRRFAQGARSAAAAATMSIDAVRRIQHAIARHVDGAWAA